MAYGISAPAIMLYGSYARGQAHKDSDIDILLIYQTEIRPGEEIRRVGSILAELNLRYQVLISVLPTTRRQYHDLFLRLGKPDPRVSYLGERDAGTMVLEVEPMENTDVVGYLCNLATRITNNICNCMSMSIR